MIFVVLATGPSMSAGLADYVREQRELGRVKAVAVCNAYQLAPWADALVCNDRPWWQIHKDALEFKGRKFSGMFVRGTEQMPRDPRFPPGTNSGLQGMRVAQMLGATRVLLLGFDMRGAHYFGAHPAPLKNSSPQKYRLMIAQFNRWRGPPVVNCTPGSALKKFPMSDIRTELDHDAGGFGDGEARLAHRG